ncbi:hypothetical protein [Candidatus Nitrosocosmicus sp. T]
MLIFSAPLPFALASSKSPYDSGYDHGCDDAGISDSSEQYINQPEKGPVYHTSEFMDGYYSGLNSCSSSSNNFDNNFDTTQQDNGGYESSQSSSNSRSQPNCDEAGLVGGLMGGAAGAALGGGIGGAGAGYTFGSKALKDICESNSNN